MNDFLIWAGAVAVLSAGGEAVMAENVSDMELSCWVVEQQPGGAVDVHDGALVIDDKAGCTVWLKEPLKAPVRISYRAKVTGGRVSDLNCFWMATDPWMPGDFFAKAGGRNGEFSTYDGLKSYYVGCGGNGNTTTRFRRYDGSGARPLLPEHDLKDPAARMEEGREYLIEITMMADGRTTWARDGKVWFDYADPRPLRTGRFGFRTVGARIEIRDFKVTGLPVGDRGR